jgi:uncharacterized membrane-anchored protein
MTVNTKSSSPLLITGAAFVAAPAIVVAAGLIPGLLGDTFALASSQSAATAFRVHIVFAAIIVLALVVLSFRAAARPRLAAAVSQVLGTSAIILGMCLVMAGSAFLGHGPGMRVALLFSSAAAELLAGVLVILAASRLAKLASEAAAPEKGTEWKRRLLPAILLSVCSLFLMAALGEFLESQAGAAGAERLATAILIAGIGGYFLLASYFLMRRLPRSRRNLWILLALNAALLLTAVVILVIEPNRTAALEMLGLSLLAIACSAAGLGLAYRFARLHGDRSEGAGQAARKDR